MSNLFDGEAKGDLIQLRDQLDGNDSGTRKQAARRVVALMRSGENVQSLFSSMLRCVRTADIELKKLSYLYLVNYSAQEPEQAIMAVNTFIQDSQDGSPLIRALAVRTMCRIKLESVAENMIIPLKKALSDPDPYVRKTAAFGVAKLYDVIPESVENAQLFPVLLNLLNDENPMVVSNTTAAIYEINERRTSPIFTLNGDTIGPLLSALSSCTEWCQTILLDALSRYTPDSHEDASFLIERLVPFLKHNNPSVVIGAFKCIFLFMEADSRNPLELFSQIIPPFITLVTSSEPEVQYVVLRTLSLFVQKFPRALSKEIRVFFCKYNDPAYVKMEKLDIIVTICTPSNAQLVLEELNEYCNAVDVAFVQKSIRCIGQIAIKIEAAAQRCVDILVSLVAGKADYAIEESIIVVCDLLRKYPGKFESILSKVCSSLENIKDPRAKAAGIWILGEYCSLIENVDVLLDPFLDTFHDENPLVQLQILSSLVKVFLEKPDKTKDQLQFVLNEATANGNVPDVKNRALVYWRLLTADTAAAKNIVVFDKQTVVHSGVRFDDSVLAELIRNMGSVSGVLHIVPSDFVRRVRFVPDDEESVIDDDSVLRYWRPVLVNEGSPVDILADFDQNHLYLRMINKSITSIGQFAIAFNKNALGYSISNPPLFPEMLDMGEIAEVTIETAFNNQFVGNTDKSVLQIALRTNAATVFATSRLPIEFAFTEAGNLDQESFRAAFATCLATATIQCSDCQEADDQQLNSRHIYVVGQNGNKRYISFALPDNNIFVGEIFQNENSIVVNLKSSNQSMLSVVEQNSQYIFAQK